MSQVITINNFGSSNILEKLELNADAAIGANALTMFNTQGATTGNPLYVGALGSETGEVVTVSSIVDSITLNLSGVTKFKHFRNDAATVLFGGKVKVWRAPNVNGTQPEDASFVELAGSPYDIDFDGMQTNITDPTGSSDYWYKFTYFNATTSAQTSLAESISVRGGNYGNYCSLEDIRNEANLSRARYITDAMVDQKRQAAQQAINSALYGLYALPFTVPIDALIRDITMRLAAGWLLMDQYDRGTVNYNQGEKKILSVTNKDKTGDLDKLQTGQSTLIGSDGSDTSISTGSVRVNGWPNQTTATTPLSQAGGGHMFGVGDSGGRGQY